MDYKDLKNLLIEASNAYYIDSNPIMTDYEFDQKLKELQKMEEQQGFADPDSPTQKPGSDLSVADERNTHKRPMLSLENTYNEDDIEKWYNDMISATGETNPVVIVNPKWDGGSGALRYDQDGHLAKALTRGNGEVGEDITQNIKYCDDNVWSVKKYNGMPFRGEARGEIIMTEAGFDKLNKDGKYQNARNLVSGSLKLLDIYDFIPRAEYITFYAYWLEDSKNTRYADDLEELKRFGFTVGEYYVCKSLQEIKDAIDKIENSEYPVAIDGAVMKLNEKKYWSIIGSTAKFPRWAKAYKYKQVSISTKVTNITFEVGRSGKITPLCWFEPKFLDGSTIQKATLNNEDFYKTMDVAIGDTVEVQKAAAIIPQIIEVTERPSDRRKVAFPKTCPNCGTKLIKKNEEHNDYYCPNENCSCRIIDKIVNYTHCVECDGFAEIIVEKLHNAGLLSSISDLYRLKDHKEEISKLDRLSMNMADKLCANVEASKTADLWKILSGLGIPNVGPKTAKTLVKHFGSIKVMSGLTVEDFVEIDDIAEITATSIIEWFKANRVLLKELSDLGVILENTSDEEHSKPNIDLSGKSFCITGALSLKRDKYIELIEACGGSVVSAVTSKTNYLITNDKDSGTKKNIIAQKLGIPILNERELLEMCDALALLKEVGE